MKLANNIIWTISQNSRGNHDCPDFKWAWFGQSGFFHDSKGYAKLVFLNLKLRYQKKQLNVISFKSEQSGNNKTNPNFFILKDFCFRKTYRIMKKHWFSKPGSFGIQTIMVSSWIMRHSQVKSLANFKMFKHKKNLPSN